MLSALTAKGHEPQLVFVDDNNCQTGCAITCQPSSCDAAPGRLDASCSFDAGPAVTDESLLARNRAWSSRIFFRLARQQKTAYLWIGCSDNVTRAGRMGEGSRNDIFGTSVIEFLKRAIPPGGRLVHSLPPGSAPPVEPNAITQTKEI